MVEKVKKDREQQNIILADIQNAIEILNRLDDVFEEIDGEQSNVDKLISDYNHLVEEYELSDESRLKISYKLSELYDRRKEIKNILSIKNCWYKNIEKLKQKDFRNQIKVYMHQTLERLDQDYKSRVMSEDDKELLLSIEDAKEIPSNNKKRKYNKIPKKDRADIIRKIEEDKRTFKEVAEEYNASVSTIYSIYKKGKSKQ